MDKKKIVKILWYIATFIIGGLSAIGFSSCSSLLVNTGTQVPSINLPTMQTQSQSVEKTDSTSRVDLFYNNK